MIAALPHKSKILVLSKNFAPATFVWDDKQGRLIPTDTVKHSTKPKKVKKDILCVLRNLVFRKSKNAKKDATFVEELRLSVILFGSAYVCELLVDDQGEQRSKKACRKLLKILLEKAELHLGY